MEKDTGKITKELNNYIINTLDTIGTDADNQRIIHLVKLLGANFNKIVKNVQDFSFCEGYSGLDSGVNIRFVPEPYKDDNDGADNVHTHEGIELYVDDLHGYKLNRMVARNYTAVDYVYYTIDEIKELAEKFRKKYSVNY